MDDKIKVTVNGEKGSLLIREQNGVLGQVSSPSSSGRREMVSRSLSGMKAFSNDGMDLEEGKVEKHRDKAIHGNRTIRIHNQALLSGLAYCISSCSMILVNKFVLSGYDFNAGISLMLYQNLVSVVIVSILSFAGIISTEPLTWRLIRVWLPVNIIFVGMLITSLFSLKYINVAMVTVLKNVTNVITALGEMYLFKKHHDSKVWAALFLMIISAVSGGITDLSFHAVGYTWQILNCFLTASYSVINLVDTVCHYSAARAYGIVVRCSHCHNHKVVVSCNVTNQGEIGFFSRQCTCFTAKFFMSCYQSQK